MAGVVETRIEEYGDIIIIAIEGEFYLESVEYVEDVWNEQKQKDPSIIAIDCSDIRYIDSSAIGILVKFLNQSQAGEVTLALIELSESVESVFRISKLENFFKTMSRQEFFETYNLT